MGCWVDILSRLEKKADNPLSAAVLIAHLVGVKSGCELRESEKESFPISSRVANSKKVSSIEFDQVESALFVPVEQIVKQIDAVFRVFNGI